MKIVYMVNVMRKKIILLSSLVCLLILFLGCNEPKDPPIEYDGAYTVTEFSKLIPEECFESSSVDYCELFDCMVDSCYCDEINYDSPILATGNKNSWVIIHDENEAFFTVQNYFESPPAVESGEIPRIEVVNVVKLNDLFYNVFFTFNGIEQNVVVAVDGAIIRTVCGV